MQWRIINVIFYFKVHFSEDGCLVRWLPNALNFWLVGEIWQSECMALVSRHESPWQWSVLCMLPLEGVHASVGVHLAFFLIPLDCCNWKQHFVPCMHLLVQLRCPSSRWLAKLSLSLAARLCPSALNLAHWRCWRRSNLIKLTPLTRWRCCLIAALPGARCR